MGNVLLQTPVAFFGFQPYFTTGGGIYQEELGTHSDTASANTGGGVKSRWSGRCGCAWTTGCSSWEAVRCIRQRTASTQD